MCRGEKRGVARAVRAVEEVYDASGENLEDGVPRCGASSRAGGFDGAEKPGDVLGGTAVSACDQVVGVEQHDVAGREWCFGCGARDVGQHSRRGP